MERIIVEISPWDTLLFRDGIPMEKGSSNYIESRAMPFPSVLYGALCSGLMENGYLDEVKKYLKYHAKEEVEKEELDKALSQNLRIKGIYLKKEDDLFIPAPLDLFETSEGEVYQGQYNTVNHLIEVPKVNDEKLQSVQGKYIKLEDYLTKYKKGRYRKIKLYDEGAFWKRYQKVGLQLLKKKNEDKHLYFINMLEVLPETSFVIDAQVKEHMEALSTNITLGGERRMAHLEIRNELAEEIDLLYDMPNEYTECIKLILTTSYKLENIGAFREIMNEIVGTLNAEQALFQAVGKLEHIAGYDMALRTNKNMSIAIPAGSCFVLQKNGVFTKNMSESRSCIERILNRTKSELFRGFGSFILEGRR